MNLIGQGYRGKRGLIDHAEHQNIRRINGGIDQILQSDGDDQSDQGMIKGIVEIRKMEIGTQTGKNKNPSIFTNFSEKGPESAAEKARSCRGRNQVRFFR